MVSILSSPTVIACQGSASNCDCMVSLQVLASIRDFFIVWQWMNAGCVTFKNNMVKHFLIIVVTDSSHRENTYYC
jgi:hypothetical protein